MSPKRKLAAGILLLVLVVAAVAWVVVGLRSYVQRHGRPRPVARDHSEGAISRSPVGRASPRA